MKFDSDLLIRFLDILGFVQGSLLGIIFLTNYRKSPALPFLGLFLLGYSIELIVSAFEINAPANTQAWLYFIPLRFYWLFMPALYLYAKSISGRMKWQKDWIHLLPAIIEFSAFGVLFLFPAGIKAEWAKKGIVDYIDTIHIVLSFLLILSYVTATLMYVRKHRKHLEQYHSSTENKTLRWISWIASYVLLTLLIIYNPLVNYFFDVSELVYSLINVCFIFWVALSGFRQMYVRPVDISLPLLAPSSLPPDLPKPSTTFLDLQTYMDHENPFKKANLTLAILAKEMKLPQRMLSELINQESGQNFNQFINKYRVEAAKVLLKDPKYNHLTILAIGFEVGFSSKSSFNTTFKLMTGQTPSAYQKAG